MKNLLKYKEYHAKIEIDIDEGFFIGTVIGINDELVFHGESYKELEEMFHQSIDNYLEMCKAFGKTPEKEYKGSFNVRVSAELHKKLDIYAMSHEKTMNQVVSAAIEQYITSPEATIDKLYNITKTIENIKINNFGTSSSTTKYAQYSASNSNMPLRRLCV